jgi:hypothetical protein
MTRIRDWVPHWTALGFVLLGLVLILASRALHIHLFTTTYGATVSRQVGYLGALNWSIGYTVLFPLVAFLMLVALQSVPKALRNIGALRMIRSAIDFRPVSADELIQQWQEDSRIVRLLVFGGIAVAMLSALGEWAINNLGPLLQQNLIASIPEVDWGLAAAIPDSAFAGSHPAHTGWYLAGNAAFDLACFAFQGIVIASIWSFFILMSDLPRLLLNESAGYRIVPRLTTEDRRCGFEAFEDVLQNALLAGLVTFLMLYLSRVQKLYMRSDGAHSIADFTANDLFIGLTQGVAGLFHFSSDSRVLFDINSSSRYAPPVGDILLLVALFLVCAFVFLLTAYTVRQCARRANRQAQEYLDADPQRMLFAEMPRETEAMRLREMTFWPMQYPSLSFLTLLILFCATTFVWYRLGLVSLGIVCLTVLTRVGKALFTSASAD